MGIACSYKLDEIQDKKATYNYGKDFDNIEGLIELDFSNLDLSKTKRENIDKINYRIVRPCDNEIGGTGYAFRVISRIMDKYLESGEYPASGGHYAG